MVQAKREAGGLAVMLGDEVRISAEDSEALRKLVRRVRLAVR